MWGTFLVWSEKEVIEQYFRESIEVKTKFLNENEDILEKAIIMITECIKRWNSILICWNGWSAADAQHIAAELTWRYKIERKSLPGIALTVDTSALTAIWNDYGFEYVFSRQLEWVWKKWDILIWISTSWNSENVIKAVEKAKEMKIKTIGLLWKTWWKLKNMVDCALVVPSDVTARIQECHMTIYHTICHMVDILFYKEWN
jgi:D-sedoheptulose 7-phosphate isomerase